MISEGLWKRKFGSDPRLLGKTIILDGQGRTIIGIIPASFRMKMWNFETADVYTPMGEFSVPQFRNRTAAWGTDALARLKPGVSLSDAAQDMARVNSSLAATYPDVDTNIKTNIVPLKEVMVGEVRPALLVLLGAVVFVLLIACVNVANLMLARSTARTREFAVRIALGAGQGRLIRQLLTESVALAPSSAVRWDCCWRIAVPRAAIALSAAGVTAGRQHRDSMAACCCSPCWRQVSRESCSGWSPRSGLPTPTSATTLNESGRSVAAARSRMQSAFVIVEMAMALLLLVGAGLMVRTLTHLWTPRSGFQSAQRVVAGDLAAALHRKRESGCRPRRLSPIGPGAAFGSRSGKRLARVGSAPHAR